ncbi:site-specific DNA-methyltransferase, partial [Nostoc sp. NIES-2111]
NEGCERLPQQAGGMASNTSGQHLTRRDEDYAPKQQGNFHPTVKPTELMRYLCRLVTPPGGVVLDPFMGSGSTGKAAVLEGFRFIGCELDERYLAIARARIAFAERVGHQPSLLEAA